MATLKGHQDYRAYLKLDLRAKRLWLSFAEATLRFQERNYELEAKQRFFEEALLAAPPTLTPEGGGPGGMIPPGEGTWGMEMLAKSPVTKLGKAVRARQEAEDVASVHEQEIEWMRHLALDALAWCDAQREVARAQMLAAEAIVLTPILTSHPDADANADAYADPDPDPHLDLHRGGGSEARQGGGRA